MGLGVGTACGVNEGLLLCRLRNIRASLHTDEMQRRSLRLEEFMCYTWDVDLR